MKIFNFINDLSSITRWSQVHNSKQESVLAHTAFVAIYAFHLALKHGENPGESVSKALMHDIDEIITGDIPTPTKYDNEIILIEIKKLENRAAMRISEDIFNGLMYEYWEKSKDVSTFSGCVVSIADVAGVVYKLWQEVSIGNKMFLKFKPAVAKALHSLYAKLPDEFDCDIDELYKILGDIK